MNQTTPLTSMIFKQLQEFRQQLYEHLGNARDAVFDLMDAILVSASIASFVSLSQSPVFRRGWSSVYASVQDSRPHRSKLKRQLVAQIATEEQPLLAGDSSDWQRPVAERLQDRTFVRTGGAQGVAGQSYSTLAWIPQGSGSWALPISHERITSFETPISKAVFQLKQVTRWLSVRPLGVYDRGYGNASFVRQTAEIQADLLLRLVSNRCVYGVAGPYRGRGAPAKHGRKFKLNDPQSWGEADEVCTVEHPQWGQVQLSRWSGYHFKQSATRSMEIIRMEILKPPNGRRKYKPLWLAWLGETMPPLETLWLKYLRRFALEHWYRFAKQRLYWTQPQFSTVQATERWSALMPWLTWQLWLARSECVDTPLPWQSAQATLTPGRVAQAFASILVVIGTPAVAPKPRGKSPGRAQEHRPPARTRYPTVKKRGSKRKKTEQSLSPSTGATA